MPPQLSFSQPIQWDHYFKAKNIAKMSSVSYIVGQPFPDERYKGANDGAVILFHDTSFDVAVLAKRPTAAEMTAFRKGHLPMAYSKKTRCPL